MPRIPQLPPAAAVNDPDELIIEQGGTTKKATKALVVASTLAVANAAQADATQALTDSATAQSVANNALANVNTALTTANLALSQVNNAVQKSGDTMTGDLDMTGNQIENLGTPIANTDAATKDYVDTNLAGKLDTSGGTMTGPINMGNNAITVLSSPSASSDAANKGYVDTALTGKQNTVATTTGVAITLDTPKEYGTYAAPETGNIAVSLTNAVRGIDQIVYHDDSVAPLIVVTGGTAVKFGPIDYDLTKVNLIVFFWMGGTNVGYIITPAV
jgi:hypothetical protein